MPVVKKLQCMQNACMTTNITIRNVPEDVRDELANRASQQRQSMQEYLLGELERLTSRPSRGAWVASVRERKKASKSRISAKKIVAARNSARR